MRYRLMDILLCPVCRNYPLELHVFEQHESKSTEDPKETCEVYCSYKGIRSSDVEKKVLLESCRSCLRIKIRWGMIVCRKCGRWFPISDEIPVMLPDELRKAEEDEDFLKMFEKEAPADVVSGGKPTHL